MAALAKYRHSFLVGLQSNLVYRWNFALRGGFSVFQLTVVFILWGAAYAGNSRIGGFDLAQTLTYFVTLILLQFFVGAFNEDYQISEDIRNGLINQFLLKPINYFLYRLSVFSAARMVSGLLVLVPLALALPLLWPYLAPPHEAWRLALGLPAAALSALIQFTIAYCFGLLTFWFLEIQSFILLSLAVETVLGGQMFPLDLLPPALFQISRYLPYFYQMYFPAAILTGRIGWSDALAGFGLQCAWAIVLLGIAQFLWTRGLRRHTAVGG
ncbi:MAG TPA: ABC-2 family transporter protein [Opitutaceae bacterium]|nr:ABC-2 family transporter protein [Opitutaceae bacterium]